MIRFIKAALLNSMLLSSQLLLAQSAITGVIKDAKTHEPLSGATVIKVSGTRQVVTTGKDGRFTIDCQQGAGILVTFIGYETYKKTLDCGQAPDIELNPTTGTLNDVLITATSNPNKSILYQPASIAKLNDTELKRGTDLFLDDAINGNIPGVSMQRRTVSAGQQFNIRGYGNGVRGTNGANSNFDGQGYKVYLNGIPVTDAEGITLLDDIDFNSIGNVEITKGPAGTLYGLAIAGVVNLKSIRAERNKVSAGQNVMLGSYGLQRFTTSLSVGGERSSLLVNYGHQHSDGFMKHTESTKDFVNLMGDFDINEKQSLTAYFGYTKSYDQRGGELTIDQYNNKDYTGNPEYIKRNAHSEVISARAGLGHTYNFSKQVSNTTTVFATGQTTNASSAGGWTDKDPINFGLRSVFNTSFDLKNDFSLSGITGVETQKQYAHTIGYNMVANPADANAYWIIGAARSNQSATTATTSVFSEWTLTMPKDLLLTAGLGYSNMHIALRDKFYVANSTKPTFYSTDYKGMWSPHIALNKIFSRQFSAYVSYSKGYKAPVSSYFFIPTTGQLNTGLKPEIGQQFEIGGKGVLAGNKLTYELALFSAMFKDKMTAIAVPLDGSTTTTAYSYIANGGDQDHKGIELLVKYTLLQSSTGFVKTLRPFGNLALSDFKYKGYSFQTLNADRTQAVIADYDGKKVAGVAPVTANLGIDLVTNPGLYFNAIYSYKDGVPITSDGVNKTHSYNLLNAKIGFQRSLFRHLDLDAFFGINNITGTQYYFMVFVNQLPDAYLPAPYKASYFGGLNLKYNF